MLYADRIKFYICRNKTIVNMEIISAIGFLILFVGSYFIGKAILEKTTDVTIDAAFKAADTTKKYGKPVVDKTLQSVEHIKKAIFKPNSFCAAWKFIEFVNMHGPHVGIAGHVTKEGKLFHTCEISDDEGKTVSVRFSASLGELDNQQIKEMKDRLFVGKTNSGKYYLYDEQFKDWQDVDI